MALNRTPWIVGIVALMNQMAFGAIDPTILPVRYGQYARSIAVGPNNTLMIWNDYRRTEDMVHEIFGTRIGPLGETLDGDGIPITGPLIGGSAVVAALQDQFLIVWSKGPTIYARRMTSAGELLDTQPIVVSANPAHPFPELVYRDLTAAADGANFWVAWNDDRNMPPGTPEYLRYQYEDIYAARINPAGRVLDRRGIRLCGKRGGQSAPRLSSRADFIVWSDNRGGRRSTFGARLHPNGFCMGGSVGIMSSTDLYTTPASAAGNGRGWLVVWGDTSGIYGAQVAREGVPTAPFLITSTTEQPSPQVQSSGKDCLVLWQEGVSTLGTRVTPAGRVGRIVTIAADPMGAAYYSFGGFAGNGARYFVTGTTAPVNSSWFYNDVWFGGFTATMFR